LIEQSRHQSARQDAGDTPAIVPGREGGFHRHDLIADKPIETLKHALIERAALAYLARLEREKRDRRHVEIINRDADRLNRQALDTLEYQHLR